MERCGSGRLENEQNATLGGGVRYWIYSIAECYVAGRALLQTKGGER